MPDYPIGRWNWSDELGKWIYPEKDENGNIKYTYQVEPPEEFLILTEKLEEINQKLMKTQDPQEKMTLFEELMKISKEMNSMRKPTENKC
jgi:hypothetical protein